MKIWIVSILPICDRFSSWFNKEFLKAGDQLGVDIEVLGLNTPCVKTLTNYFTNEYEAVEHEISIIKVLNTEVLKGDKVLWLDLDYPGFAVSMAFLLKLRGVKSYGILHGAYFNEGDVWASTPERRWFMKAGVEVCEKVFVGSEYFKSEIVRNLDVDPSKIVATGLPFDPSRYRFDPNVKKDIVVVVEERKVNIPNYIVVEGRNLNYEYFKKLLEVAKYMIVFKKAETFGYAVLEALASGVIVLTPKKFSYPEFKSDKDDLLVFVETFDDAIKFVSTHKWDVKDVTNRYFNTYKVIERYRDSAVRILEEVAKDG